MIVGSAMPYAIFRRVVPVFPRAGDTVLGPANAYTTMPTTRYRVVSAACRQYKAFEKSYNTKKVSAQSRKHTDASYFGFAHLSYEGEKANVPCQTHKCHSYAILTTSGKASLPAYAKI